MTASGQHLPHIDEHRTEIEADADAVWEALLRTVERSFGSTATARAARLLGCADTETTGPHPLAPGSALPGFHVEAATQARELALAGRHRFSDYALIFRLEGHDDTHTTLRAETRAVFPGLKGGAYKTLVIGTRAHILVTRRLLAGVKGRAEKA